MAGRLRRAAICVRLTKIVAPNPRIARDIFLGAFFCALGVMHFLETYLTSTFYVTLPFGVVATPGSTVL